MDEKNKDENLEMSPEEQKAEQEALAEVKDEDLRGQLAESMGIDPELEGDLLDKFVTREKESRSKLSGAIKQKIKWRGRAEAKTAEQKPPQDDGGAKPENKGDSADLTSVVGQKVSEIMEERDLKDLNLPEEIETEVKELAKAKGLSVREAFKLPYVVFRVGQFNKDERIEAASPKRGNEGSYSGNVDLSKPLDPANFNFGTKEGVNDWNKTKAARAAYMKTQGL